MKKYKSFKLIGSVRDIADCYMVGLWKGEMQKDKAIALFKLYFKNWAEGLEYQEWLEAKSLIEFWKKESKKYYDSNPGYLVK